MNELTRIIDETIDEIKEKTKAEFKKYDIPESSKEYTDMDPASTIPFSTEE